MLGYLLLPFRILSGLCFLAFGSLVTKLWLRFQSPREGRYYSPTLQWLHQLICRAGMLFTFGVVAIRVHPANAKLKCPIRVVSNHPFIIDPVTLIAAFGAKFVSKQEVSGYSFVKDFCAANGTLFFDRKDPAQRKRIQEDILRDCDPFAALVVFPEGTNNQQRGMFSFQLGAFRDHQPVAFTAVKYNIWPPDSKRCLSCANSPLQRMSSSEEVVFLLTRLWTTIDIYVHPATTGGRTLQTPDSRAQEAQRWIAEKLRQK